MGQWTKNTDALLGTKWPIETFVQSNRFKNENAPPNTIIIPAQNNNKNQFAFQQEMSTQEIQLI